MMPKGPKGEKRPADVIGNALILLASLAIVGIQVAAISRGLFGWP
jgi:hypothetical protein